MRVKEQIRLRNVIKSDYYLMSAVGQRALMIMNYLVKGKGLLHLPLKLFLTALLPFLLITMAVAQPVAILFSGKTRVHTYFFHRD